MSDNIRAFLSIELLGEVKTALAKVRKIDFRESVNEFKLLDKILPDV